MSKRILVVEDDADTRAYLVKSLRALGYVVEETGSGRDALYIGTGAPFDLLLLDRMLPDLDGLAVLRSLRGAGVTAPAILVTAVGAIDERVKGLRSGADDYLVKPYAMSELEARLEALLRRPRAAPKEETELVCGDLRLDLIARAARRGAREIDLQRREFQMLEFLMRRLGRVVTRSMMLEGIWDYHFDPTTNVVDVHISRLRRKVDEPGEPPLIRTVRGAGYMMSDKA